MTYQTPPNSLLAETPPFAGGYPPECVLTLSRMPDRFTHPIPAARVPKRRNRELRLALAEARLRYDVAAYQVAEAAGISGSYLQAIVSGSRRAPVQVKKRIADALGRRVEELFPTDDHRDTARSMN